MTGQHGQLTGRCGLVARLLIVAGVGAAIAEFFIALTASVVQSGRSLSSVHPELVVEKPDGFRLAIDVI